ncbi:MAG: hypothetical protein NT129_06600 [Candidatus Aenigmarchaeota archaeon]|nr:hypothetical protein [Candidatus Aenigmarchaeota archaeon]
MKTKAIVAIMALFVATMGVAAFAVTTTTTTSTSTTTILPGTPTQANVPVGIGDAPIVKAKWETVPSAGSALDDDPSMPWTQVTPIMDWKAEKNIGFWAVVTDPNGFGDLTDYAYVEVYHPDGSPKYQVELTELYNSCPEDTTEIAAAIQSVEDADAAGLITYNTGYDLQDLIDEIEQCSAKVFYGEAPISNCQMCGEFDWSWECTATNPPCNGKWTAYDKTGGYKVEAYAFDKYNVKSAFLTNYFEFICTAGIETDFTSLNFGNVIVSSNKWIEGDWDYDWQIAPGPACPPGLQTGCRPPTVKNVGNTPVQISVEFDDMDFGYSGPSTTKNWNVIWDARFGLKTASYFDPYVPTTLEGELPKCESSKISFSIHVEKAVTTGGHDGQVWIEPVELGEEV